MTRPDRPSLQRQHTRTSEEKRSGALEEGLRLNIDGEVIEVRAGDLSALDAQALRREIGMGFSGLLRAFQVDPDIDLIAALVWLHRRLQGSRQSYAQVAAEIGYDVLDSIEVVSEEDAPSGEA